MTDSKSDFAWACGRARGDGGDVRHALAPDHPFRSGLVLSAWQGAFAHSHGRGGALGTTRKPDQRIIPRLPVLSSALIGDFPYRLAPTTTVGPLDDSITVPAHLLGSPAGASGPCRAVMLPRTPSTQASTVDPGRPSPLPPRPPAVSSFVGVIAAPSRAFAAGAHPATLAAAWVKAHPAVTAPIIGARNVEQLEASLAAADYEMSAEQWKEISDLTPPVPVATDRDEERTS